MQRNGVRTAKYIFQRRIKGETRSKKFFQKWIVNRDFHAHSRHLSPDTAVAHNSQGLSFQAVYNDSLPLLDKLLRQFLLEGGFDVE
jgi:hypothetical protein